MKYIRIKSGKIEDLDTMSCVGSLPKENYIKFNAIKQSDNIEDLFDELIIVYDDGSHETREIHDGYECAKTKIELIVKFTRLKELYGAIWTDKGLIYVAKMNNIGEWELL